MSSNQCAAFNCQNNRTRTHLLRVMPHVRELQWHGPSKKTDYDAWTRKLQRDDFQVSKFTSVCSNHFRYPEQKSKQPSLYLRGYPHWARKMNELQEDVENIKSPEIGQSILDYTRSNIDEDIHALFDEQTGYKDNLTDPIACLRNIFDTRIFHRIQGKVQEAFAVYLHGEEFPGSRKPKKRKISGESVPTAVLHPQQIGTDINQHTYSKSPIIPSYDVNHLCPAISKLESKLLKQAAEIKHLEGLLYATQAKITEMKTKIDVLIRDNDSLKKATFLSAKTIENNDEMTRMYTGLDSYRMFLWVVEEARPGAKKMKMWNAKHNYGDLSHERMGPERKLSFEDEVFLTLVRLRQDINHDVLAHMFGISEGLVSTIISTYVPFLALELEGLIDWPDKEKIPECYPEAFKHWKFVTCIVDCFEIKGQKPSHTDANSKMFSSYKNCVTVKFLIAITPSGQICFISKAAGGNMSDDEIFNECGILKFFLPHDICMVDKGFRVEGVLLEQMVKLVRPHFVEADEPFTDDQNEENGQITHSRIHVERVIGHVRDYKILNGIIPVQMFDLVTPIVKLICILTNIRQRIVPV